MKKILPLFLSIVIMLLLGTSISHAQNSAADKFNNLQPAQPTETIESAKPAETAEDEDIDKYFTEEQPDTTPEKPQKEIKAGEQGLQQEQTVNDYTGSNTDQTSELNGYVQYNDEQQEETAIHLEPVETKNINFSQPKKIDSSAPEGFKKPKLFPMENNALESASKFSTQEYDIAPVSSSFSGKVGKFSFGTMYNSSMGSARANYSTGIFSKYEGKYFALSTIYSKSTNSNYDSYSDKFSFAPELKLTKRLSLLDVMQTDVYRINTSNEVVLRYTPHMKKYADDIQFEVGAGQSYYDANYINSSVRFSTRFKL